MGSSKFSVFMLSMLALGACASRSGPQLLGEGETGPSRTIALFNEPRYTARCFTVIEPEPSQFVSIDLASVAGDQIIQSLEDCAQASTKGSAIVGSYVSDITRIAANGMKPLDRVEFSPKQWPAEFRFNNKTYHIFQGKVLSVESE